MAHPTLTTDVASEYAERLASLLGEDLLRVSLFGSRARGEAGPRSDFDLMVVLRRGELVTVGGVDDLLADLHAEKLVHLPRRIP